MPKVSVIIAVFNGERFIRSAVESVLSQTYRDFEIVVADDGSTDRTGEIIRKLGHRIVYKRQTNAGPVAARNLGVASSSGEYVAFLDHDDLWCGDKLERQVGILDRSSDVGMVCSEVDNITEEGRPIRRKTWAQRRGIRGDLIGNFNALLRRSFPVTVPSTWVIRRALLDKLGHFDPDIPFGGYGELEFCARLAEYSLIYFVNASLVQYRVREGGITKQREAEMYANYVLVLDKLWQRWRDQPDRRGLLLRLYGRYWFKRGREKLRAGDYDAAAKLLASAVCFRPFYLRPRLWLLGLQVRRCFARNTTRKYS